MPRRTWTFDKFDAGLDTRNGYMARRNELVWRKRDNVFIDRDGYPSKRPPCKALDVTLDSRTQGLFLYKGNLTTIADAAVTNIVHGGADASEIKTVYFNAPGIHTASWELLQCGVMAGQAWAVIRHHSALDTRPWVVFHAFDKQGPQGNDADAIGAPPTYCLDPWAPGNVLAAYTGAPSPEGATGVPNGREIYDPAFEPVIASGASKGFGSLIGGDVAASITSDIRSWNTLSSEEADLTGHLIAGVYEAPESSTSPTTVTLEAGDSPATVPVPANAVAATVELWGGGGGGGGSHNYEVAGFQYFRRTGGGGGGGAYSTDTFGVTPGDDISVTIGSGGAAGTNHNDWANPPPGAVCGELADGGDGGDSSVAYDGVVRARAGGGDGGTLANTSRGLGGGGGQVIIGAGSVGADGEDGSSRSALSGFPGRPANAEGGEPGGSPAAGVGAGGASQIHGIYCPIDTDAAAGEPGQVKVTFFYATEDNAEFATDYVNDEVRSALSPVEVEGALDGSFAITRGGWVWPEYLRLDEGTWRRFPVNGDYGCSEVIGYDSGGTPVLTSDFQWFVGPGRDASAPFDVILAENKIKMVRTSVDVFGDALVRFRFSWGRSPCGTDLDFDDISGEGTATASFGASITYAHPFLGAGSVAAGSWTSPGPAGVYLLGAGPNMATHGVIAADPETGKFHHHEWFAVYEPVAYAVWDGAVWSAIRPLVQAADTNSEGYLQYAVYSASRAGEQDAAVLPTSQHEDSGAEITSLSRLRDRLLVQYPDTSQLWSVPLDPTDAALLDRARWGTGLRTISVAAETPLGTLTSGERVPRLAGLDSQLGDYLTQSPAGDNLLGLSIGDMPFMGYWGHHDMVVYAGTVDDTLQFLTMRIDPSRRKVSWAQWAVSGITALDPRAFSPVVAGPKLYFRAQAEGDSSASSVLYFDGEFPDYQDFADSEPFTAVTEFEPFDFRLPGAMKRFQQFRIVQEGECAVDYLLAPYGAPTEAHPLAAVDGVARKIGNTYGNQMLPMASTSAGLGLRFTNNAAGAWRLFRFGFDYTDVRGA